jgi:AcrR family transcriptional regulator
MARTVKEPAVRRKEILDVAQRLVYTKGYEQMTIQDILDELHISKGAFYHYFDSKQSLLEALLEQLQDTAEQLLLPIVNDTQLPALEKLQRLLSTAGRWKADQMTLMLAIMRIWYADENVLVRQKQLTVGLLRVVPLFAAIVRQGVAEGIFSTLHPDQAGEIIFSLGESLANALAGIILTEPPAPAARSSGLEPVPRQLERMQAIVCAYNDAFERVLGAPPGSIVLVEPQVLHQWAGEPD